MNYKYINEPFFVCWSSINSRQMIYNFLSFELQLYKRLLLNPF